MHVGNRTSIRTFNWIHLPLGIKVIVALFMMDFFGQYLPHYAMHRYKWMWKFHLVHHSDSKVDVTTGTRHHPGEWLFRESSTILGVFVLGLPVGLYFLYRSTAAIFTHFNHANFSLPMAL
jgi:sterol desaturase/sphingolipid hydroxylase (fatty acid hydroxylase superfamily)